uniref:Eukaryotic translation initiation factor 4E binding protein 2 n=1 Tax=Athene cunicularia TaxID=194338 RepID=A0A663N651_ATHCN
APPLPSLPVPGFGRGPWPGCPILPRDSWKKALPGTRIIYDRKFLLDRRNSPMAQTPPCHLPNIPGVTSPVPVLVPSSVPSSACFLHRGFPQLGRAALDRGFPC